MNQVKDEFLQKLQKSLSYDLETGTFFWKSAPANRVKNKRAAGAIQKSGRLRIKFEGKDYYAYRLAWLLTYGKWPEGVIDHIDGDVLNNRIANLRDVAQSVNLQNKRKANSNSKSGLLGVGLHKASGMWRAQIGVCKKVKHLGLFADAGQAHEMYLSQKRANHEGCTI